MNLVFATNNNHKLTEIREAVGSSFNILSLADIKCFEEIPETGDTLEANALQKARYIFDKYGLSCFADDTGLEIDSLNGEPGVYSARYAGLQKDAEDNMKKVLSNLEGKNDRTASFRTVIALIIDEKEWFFEGAVNGTILNERQGEEGFGYDPIFMPKGFNQSFAEMPLSEKNEISHRARAVKKLIQFLNIEYEK